MRTRFLSAWVFCFVGLNTMACLRSLDSDKIPCTSTRYCPSQYICVDGYCRVGKGDSGTPADAISSGDGPRSEKGDTELVGQSDSATSSPDTPVMGTGGMGGTGADADVAGTTGTTGIAGSGAGSKSTGGATPGTAGASAGGGSTTGGALVTSTSAGGASGTSGPAGTTAKGGSTSGGTVATSGGTSGTAGAAGSSSKGGASGGTPTSGGTTASSSASGGATMGGSGGSSTTSSATCQPKARDCTSTQDNNCNGIPDNQETTYCACPVGQKRDCRDQYDGIGICKKGSQTCEASTDKTTSSWSECSGFVAPGTEVCDAAGEDENCDGRSNEGCECVNGTSIPCDCGSPTTCANGNKGTCSVTKVTMYRDFDTDDHGEAQATQVCPGTAGYVESHDDCDDRDSAFHPGLSVCSSATQSKHCSSGGVTSYTTCDYGCAGAGQCHSAADVTIGLPGYVSCTNVSNCFAADGCRQYDTSGLCGTTGSGGAIIHCDGPNDCPGQKCLMYTDRTINETKCYPAVPSENPDNYHEVCDPLASTCQAPQVCTKQGLYPMYACE
jgi:hypothetical protein